jgi:nucleoprotein TPR
LVAQNTILHQHLESVSSQAAKIREAVDARAPSEGDSDSANADTRVNDLQSIVNYLRKEKSIVDLQLDMSKTEIARLKTQIEHLSQTLQETRETLSQVSEPN